MDFGVVVVFQVNYWPGPSIIVLGFAAIVQVSISLILIESTANIVKRIGESSGIKDTTE